MKRFAITATILLGSISFAIAQSSGGGSGGSSSSGGASAAGTSGSTLSNGTTLSGTGGAPGPNTSNAKSRGIKGDKLGVTAPDQNGGGSRPTYNTPIADAAVRQLGNTNLGILKK